MSKTEIEQNALIIVEGKDEKNFLEAYFENKKTPKVQIEDVGGKSVIKSSLFRLKKMRGFEKVEKLAIIRDADNNPIDAFKSVSDSLKEASLSVPANACDFSVTQSKKPIVGVFISPGNKKNGCLETILKGNLKYPSYWNCVEKMFNCASKKKNEKRMMLAYLSLMSEYCNCIGIAAKKKYFNFSSFEDSDLGKFLDKFINL